MINLAGGDKPHPYNLKTLNSLCRGGVNPRPN
jgi:hypothetical protein